ncbi:IclR family transcriptional regulator [Amycolatopsis jejuensis]|uniref:IclR family transcriptional regulator n=1 Tax=Amycolatopsis jejuensis TaxID=330084 RepID=UPI00138E29A8|nr:IclR family transcriptional regulator [Amycolatopsis jejuensis]
MDDGPKPTMLQTVERALNFLEHVASAPQPQTVKEVAEALGINLATGYHLLRTLSARGYLERRPDATLTLGSSVGALFHAYQSTLDVDSELAGIVRRIAADTSETAYLSTLDGSNVIVKACVEGTQQLRVSALHVGRAGDEMRRASGKAVLAHLAAPRRDEIINRNLRDHPARERAKLRAQFEEEQAAIRARGWAVDDQESVLGVTGIGAPVFAASGEIHGAIGLVTPTFRMERSHDEFVAVVAEAAATASRLMGGTPWTSEPEKT